MRAFVAALLLGLPVAFASACSEPCEDVDGDGFGAACRPGPDCDDRNAARNVDCVAQPAPDCVATPTAAGCPCSPGTIAPCYDGPSGTDTNAPCAAGVAICPTGFYDVCRNQVLPGTETCNLRDDDCDGLVDEFVRSPCGTCDASCEGVVWGPDGLPFTPNDGLRVTTSGALQLDDEPVEFDALWLANTGEDTVSHIDPTARAEVARHPSGGDDPSRVAVDYRGDVFVVNRAPEGQGTLTKLAGNAARCVDRDGVPGIRTSTGPSDVPALADDECVLYSVPVGAPMELPRPVAVDGTFEPGGGGGGDVWVGLYAAEAVLQVDGETGAVLDRVELPGLAPYALAFDGRGGLWAGATDGRLAHIDPGASPKTVRRVDLNLRCYQLYAMAFDDDARLLGTGHGCDQLFVYDPWVDRITTARSSANPRGITIGDGLVFTPHTDGRLGVFSLATLASETLVDLWTLGRMPVESIGVALSPDQAIWVVSAQGGGGDLGLVSRIDPITYAVTDQLPVGVAPHTHGDLAGGGLFGAFRPRGETTRPFAPCSSGAQADWLFLHVEGQFGALSSVRIDGRWAPTEDDLTSASFVELATLPGAATPVSLAAFPDGGAIELRLVLSTSTRDATPRVSRIGVEVDCVVDVEN